MENVRIFEYINKDGVVCTYKFENNRCIGFFEDGEKRSGIADGDEFTQGFENGLNIAGFREVQSSNLNQ